MLHVSVCCAIVSVHCSLVVTCLERADLLAVVCCGFLCFVTFPNVPWSTSELGARLASWNWFSPPVKYFLLTVPRRYFFCGSFVFLCLVFLMLLRFFIAALWLPAGKGLASWLLLVMFIVCLLLSHVVSWVRCGTWLYRFLILPSFLLLQKRNSVSKIAFSKKR